MLNADEIKQEKMGQTQLSCLQEIQPEYELQESNQPEAPPKMAIPPTDDLALESTSPSFVLSSNELTLDSDQRASVADVIEKLQEMHHKAEQDRKADRVNSILHNLMGMVKEPMKIDYKQIAKAVINRWLESKLNSLFARKILAARQDTSEAKMWQELSNKVCMETPPVFLSDSSVYFGDLNSAKEKEGQGTSFNEDNSIYEGGWKAGKYHGQGTLLYNKSSVYSGAFKYGLFHGIGSLVTPGYSYAGEWKSSQKHGFGTEQIEGVHVYTGNFESDMKHGKGEVTYQDGGTFVGNFINDLYEGYGVKTFRDGTICEGEWLKGKLLEGELYDREKEPSSMQIDESSSV